MVKAAFFDIDGTLVSFNTHNIPESALDALRKARQQGVKLFIVTGRPKQFLYALTDVLPMFDGLVTSNGACCYMGGKVLHSMLLPHEQVVRIVDECKQKGLPCSVIGREKISFINDTPELRQVYNEILKIDINMFRAPIEEVLEDEVFQVIPFIDASHEKALLSELPDCMGLRWHPAFVDITRKGTDKGQALCKVAEIVGIGIADTMAFGDGGNDIAMLRAAGVGVAMGNAGDDVKANADYVTDSVDEDGIANAFKKFNSPARCCSEGCRKTCRRLGGIDAHYGDAVALIISRGDSSTR